MSSSFAKLDGFAAKLQAKASDFLKSTPETDEEGNPTTAAGGKREALLNMAKIVQEQTEKGVGTSKEYLSSVITQVSTYANDASANAREKGYSLTAAKEAANVHIASVQGNLNKAIEVGKAQGQGQLGGTSTTEGTTDRELPAASETESLSFPFNIVAWIVSFCVSKTGASTSSDAAASSTTKEFSTESLQNAAEALTNQLDAGQGGKVEAAGEK